MVAFLKIKKYVKSLFGRERQPSISTIILQLCAYFHDCITNPLDTM